LISKLI
jgi:hypothetical protein